MNSIKGYANMNIELELVKLNLKEINKKEEMLKKEKELYLNWQEDLEQVIKEIEAYLKELKGIEKELFYEVVVKGTNVTRAIDKLAYIYDLEPSTIWKNYYPKAKENILLFKNKLLNNNII